jgi:DNA helicase-2/ATP-dependent DNA helicase PcrA
MSEGDVLRLDPSQQQAASIAAGERQIVLAPPGSGKTEVVAALLEHLVDEGLDSFDDVLAISFSRAAVGALDRRTRRGSGSARATIRTLDSLASRILDDSDEEGDWRALSFDARIARALSIVEIGVEVSDLVSLQHLIVDEVQDLVGVRARLVLAILNQLPEDTGFTLLGDPHQAVYDFQLADAGDLTSAQFLEAARGLGSVTQVRLTQQYRARSPEARAATTLLLDSAMDDQRIRTVRTFVSQLLTVGAVEDLGRPLKRWKGSTAFLCRTNGQALLVADRLRQAGAPATMRAAAEDLPLASWIAEVFEGQPTRVVAKDDALALLAERAPIPAPDAWRLLKDVEREFRAPNRLDLTRLARGLSRGVAPANLVASSATDVVVSTIHRAKGLEFDNVVLVNSSELLPGSAADEDASVAYVAVTRARDRLLTVRCPAPDYLRIDKRTGRWIVGGYKLWMTSGFEVRGIDSRTPEVSGLAQRGRDYVGRDVVGEVDRVRSTLDVPIYSLLCGGELVARTTEDFGRLLAVRLGGHSRTKRPWPRLTGLAVDSVETLIGSGDEDNTPMLCVGVRVSGMAMLNWGDEARHA